MPVSHLALVVSNLSAAIPFYERILQPLGYNFCGRQGDAVGFGIDDAEFFLCEAKNRHRVTPTHIAFAANDRLVVRKCYTAALNAGARPSGPPQYRNNDCTCFNAAIEDYDGNTIEFIFREGQHLDRESLECHGSRSSRDAPGDCVDSVAKFANRAQSTAHKVHDLAPASFTKLAFPTPGVIRSRTEPLTYSNNAGGKAIVGTLLGAAAGAAFAYAIVRSERENATDEAEFNASIRSRQSQARTTDGRSSRPKSMNRTSPTQPPRAPQPQIEAPRYYEESQAYPARPQPLARSRTYDAIEYRPRVSSVGKDSRFGVKRASTLPAELEPGSHHDRMSSRYSSRRRSEDDSQRSSRHDSGVSTRSSHRSRRSSFSKTSAARRSAHYESAANVPLPSSRSTSYHTVGESTPRASQSRSYVSAAHIPLPNSRAPSYLSGASVPLPPSEFRGGYADVADDWDGIDDREPVRPDDSISCVNFSEPKKKKSGGGGSRKHGSGKSSRHSSRRSEADSERTVRPLKVGGSRHSVWTLPVRPKEEYTSRNGRRSTATYA